MQTPAGICILVFSIQSTGYMELSTSDCGRLEVIWEPVLAEDGFPSEEEEDEPFELTELSEPDEEDPEPVDTSEPPVSLETAEEDDRAELAPG